MALPTETLPQESADDLNDSSAYFDQAKKLKQEKNLAVNVSTTLPPEVQVNSVEESKVSSEDQGGQTAEEYQPFPLNPEEEIDESVNQDADGDNEEGDDEQQLLMMQAQLDQARQLALLKAQAEQVQAAELAETEENSSLVTNIEEVAVQKPLEADLSLTCWAALPVIVDFTGAAWAAAVKLNLQIIGSVLGFNPLVKPKIQHYIMLIIVDLEIIIAIIVILFLINLLVYIGEHPFKIGWEAFKDWVF